MPTTCSAYGCTNRHSKDKKISFFSLPFNDEELLRKWLHNIKRKNWTPKNSSKICSDHFKDTDFENTAGFRCRKLRKDAVPSIFPEMPEHLQKKTKPRCTRNSTKNSTTPEMVMPHTNHLVEEAVHPETIQVDNEITSASIQINNTNTRSLSQARALKLLRLKVKRLQQRNSQYKKMIVTLRAEKEQTEKSNAEWNDMFAEIVENEKKNQNRDARGRRYSEPIKKLALSLQYTSNKCYEACRRFLTLPSSSSITAWTSSVNCEPGFLEEIITSLSSFPDTDRDATLIIDAISIKKGIVMDSKKGEFVGFSDYGNCIPRSTAVQATEALFFLLVSIKGTYRIPIAYFLQDKINATTMAELITMALRKCDANKILVRCIVFDGLSTNFSAFKYLVKQGQEGEYEWIEEEELNGEEDDNPTIVHDMLHPTDIPYKFRRPNPTMSSNTATDIPAYVYAIPDNCHMTKLARNALENWKR